MGNYHIRNVRVINEKKITECDVLVRNKRIERVDPSFSVSYNTEEINGEDLYLMPGIIDDQVHFREPGLTHKANIYSEAKSGVAGGVTTFMEMPNVNPLTLTNSLLEDKFEIASRNSLANYSFYLGAGHNNMDELLKVDSSKVCGIKIFMGSSTGDMLVDNPDILDRIFSERNDILIATHCEDDKLVKERLELFKAKYGSNIPFECHPEIRNEQVCLNSSTLAVNLARKHNSRLHILHISTADELALFTNRIPLKEKRITTEVCVHHLWFDKEDYSRLGSKIKCNPAIKEKHHKKTLFEALLDDRLDIIATDHAPHTLEEKAGSYLTAPAGLPLLQHSLNVMLQFYHEDKISLEKIIEKMCHAPAECFQVKERGYIREGYFADLALFDLKKPYTVHDAGTEGENVLYKCGWSPFNGFEFNSKVLKTFVNGNLIYDNGVFNEQFKGERLEFLR